MWTRAYPKKKDTDLFSDFAWTSTVEHRFASFPPYGRLTLVNGAALSTWQAGRRRVLSNLHAGKKCAPGAVSRHDLLVVVLQHMHVELRLQQRLQFRKAHGDHGMFVVPDLGFHLIGSGREWRIRSE